ISRRAKDHFSEEKNQYGWGNLFGPVGAALRLEDEARAQQAIRHVLGRLDFSTRLDGPPNRRLLALICPVRPHGVVARQGLCRVTITTLAGFGGILEKCDANYLWNVIQWLEFGGEEARRALQPVLDAIGEWRLGVTMESDREINERAFEVLTARF